jgi:hypothetical protein
LHCEETVEGVEGGSDGGFEKIMYLKNFAVCMYFCLIFLGLLNEGE